MNVSLILLDKCKILIRDYHSYEKRSIRESFTVVGYLLFYFVLHQTSAFIINIHKYQSLFKILQIY